MSVVAISTPRHLLPYSFPRSLVLHMHQLTTATSDASMASFLRRSSTARYPPAMVRQQGTFPDSDFLTYQIPTPPLSQVTFAYAHQQSNVIRDSHPQGRNGKSRYDFDTATTGPSTSGMCHKSAHQDSDGATFSSSRGIIGIMGLSCLLPLVSPCPDGLVLAARSDHLAIGSPSDGIHLRGPVSLFLQSDWFTMHVVTYLVLVAWKIHGHVSCPHVPDFEGGVLASCDQEPAVRAPGALVDLCGGVRLGGSIKA